MSGYSLYTFVVVIRQKSPCLLVRVSRRHRICAGDAGEFQPPPLPTLPFSRRIYTHATNQLNQRDWLIDRLYYYYYAQCRHSTSKDFASLYV